MQSSDASNLQAILESVPVLMFTLYLDWPFDMNNEFVSKLICKESTNLRKMRSNSTLELTAKVYFQVQWSSATSLRTSHSQEMLTCSYDIHTHCA